MKKLGIAFVFVAASVASLPSHAMDVAQGARFGAGGGRYSGEASTRLFDGSGNPAVFPVPCPDGSTSSECKGVSVTGTYGGELGYTLSLSDFYADVGLNMLRTKSEDQNLWRTDLLFTVGYYLTENWSLFGGFRRGWQGDGIFNDDVFQELGPYLGVGFGGIPLGGWGTLNVSAAYNFDKVKDFPVDGKDLDYPGVSLKLGMNFKNTPHSLQLRLQRFSGDDSLAVGPGRLEYELEENWAVLSYVFTLAW